MLNQDNWDMEPLVEEGKLVGYTTWSNIYGRGVWNGSNVIHIDDGGPHSGLYYTAGVEIESYMIGVETDFYFLDFVEVIVNSSGFRDIKRNIRKAIPLPKFSTIR